MFNVRFLVFSLCENTGTDLPGTVPLLARAGRMHSPGTSNATLMRAEHRWQPASLPTDASRGDKEEKSVHPFFPLT